MVVKRINLRFASFSFLQIMLVTLVVMAISSTKLFNVLTRQYRHFECLRETEFDPNFKGILFSYR